VARLRDHPTLVVLTAALAAGEAMLILAVGPDAAVALAPQVSAPAPYGVFHDLRWLLVYHSSWLAFIGEAIVLLGFRTAVDTVLLRAAWPRDRPLPPWREHAVHTARFTTICALVLLLFAVLVFAMGVTSLSWLFFVAVPVLVMVAGLTHHGAVDPRWWRDPPVRRSVGAVVLAFGVLTIAGGVLAALPSWLVPLAAVGAGVGMAWCRLRLVHALAGRAPAPRRRPFVLVGLAGVLALVVGGTAIGFAVSVAVEEGRTPPPEVSTDATGPPVLIVKGFNSKWDGVTRREIGGDHRIRRFSYRGLDATGEPRPYGRDETHASLRTLALAMRAQVDAFHDATGEQVSIVAESEGALVAQAYLSATPQSPVEAAVLLSPLLDPGRVFFPSLGESGWGVVSGTILDGIATTLAAVGPVDVTADAPLFRSLVDEAPALRPLLRCRVPGVREFAVLPLDSGVSVPAFVDAGEPSATVPAFHGGLLGDATTKEIIGAVLDGRHAEGSGFWSAAGDGLNAIAAAWQVPSIEPDLVPEWSGFPDPDSCAAARAELRRWLSLG